MRTSPHLIPFQLQLLRSCLHCFVILKALLLNVQQLAEADNGAFACYTAASHPTCSMFQNRTSIFPFLMSQACGSASSFAFSGCDTADPKPRWLNFGNATIAGNTSISSPFVIALSQASYFRNSSFTDANTSTDITGSGSIDLTWSNTLIQQNACQSRIPRSNISAYLPQSIDLTSFAHSSFQFTASNIFLLFNCSKSPSSIPHKFLLEKNSSSCSSYVTDCKLPNKESPNCYQYKPDGMRELNLSVAMESLDCEYAMFFVVPQFAAVPASQWSPGLIELNWSTIGNRWMDSNLKDCEGCLQSGGACGYNNNDNFLCYCANNKSSDTNCTVIYTGCNGLLCSTTALIIIGVVWTVVTIPLILLVNALKRGKTSRSLFVFKTLPSSSAERSTNQRFFKYDSFARHLDFDGLTERPIEFKYASIVHATKEFSHLLGEGGFGAVYKGTLGDAMAGVQIAVKVLGARSKHMKKQFLNEVTSIGRIHHVHVVRLLGFCIEESHVMLVYEYVINGSLDTWLFHRGGSEDRVRVLLWEQRYAIAIGIAKGLSYLHEECRHRIVHCDIKPHNILLDEQLCPKIADFGLARLMGKEESRVATLARGTPGYIGPEFWLLGGESQLSTKLDVYSYGMVLLEMISGQRNFGQDVCFPEVAFEAAMSGEFESIMDAELGIAWTSDGECIGMDGTQRQQVKTAVLVALWCIQDHPRNRPSMSEVVQYLEGIAAINEQPPRPTIASYIISNSAPQQLCLSDEISTTTSDQSVEEIRGCVSCLNI